MSSPAAPPIGNAGCAAGSHLGPIRRYACGGVLTPVCGHPGSTADQT